MEDDPLKTFRYVKVDIETNEHETKSMRAVSERMFLRFIDAENRAVANKGFPRHFLHAYALTEHGSLG